MKWAMLQTLQSWAFNCKYLFWSCKLIIYKWGYDYMTLLGSHKPKYESLVKSIYANIGDRGEC